MAQTDSDLVVVGLCAEWCGTCREYRLEFDRLAEQFSGARFRWMDIEEHAECLGDIDVENFPTILVRRGKWVLFFGVMLPQIGHLRRLIEVLAAQSPEQSEQYAFSTPELAKLQEDPDLPRIGID